MSLTETPRPAAAPVENFVCSKCGYANPESADFCIQCHNTLVHRCPKCWHAQRQDGICEKCGTNMALFAEVALERSMAEEDSLWWAKFWAGVGVYAQLLLLPFTTVGGLLRSLVIRLASMTVSRR